MTRAPNTLHIGLLWHSFGHDNLGVDALSRANHALISDAASALGLTVQFTTFGGGNRDVVPDMPDNVVIGAHPGLSHFVAGRLDFFSQIKDCDLVLDIGEGDSFADIYGLKRLALQLVTKLGAIVNGVPLVLSPQTIGPFNNALGRKLAVAVMDRSKLVLARDHISKAFLDKTVTKAPTDEFIDVAFALPFDQQPRLAGRTRVGVNVSGLLFNNGYSGKNELGMKLDYASFTRQLIEKLLSAGAEVHLFAHVADWQNLRDGEFTPDDDQSAIQKLQAEFPQVEVAPIFSSSTAVKSWMSGLDFVVAGRMHACIGAFSAGVPVVPIAYSRKFNGLFQSLNYPYFVDGKAESTDKALTQVLEWFHKRDDLQKGVAEGKRQASTKLNAYVERLKLVLQDVSRK